MKIEIISRAENLTTYGVYKNNLQPVGVIEETSRSRDYYALTNSTNREEIKKAFYKYMSIA